MKRCILQLVVFLIIALQVCAHESRLAPEAEALALVHGCVNVITGEFVQQETDLFIDGPSPLGLTRIYDSGNSNVSSSLGAGFTWSIARQIRFLEFYDRRTKDDEGNWVDGGHHTNLDGREGGRRTTLSGKA